MTENRIRCLTAKIRDKAELAKVLAMYPMPAPRERIHSGGVTWAYARGAMFFLASNKRVVSCCRIPEVTLEQSEEIFEKLRAAKSFRTEVVCDVAGKVLNTTFRMLS